jgi:methionine-rich copper-binding protein CopC
MISGRLRFMAALTLALSCLFGSGVGLASAHAQYDGSTPAANSTVSAAPTTLQINYTEELSAIQISVKGPHGAEVTTAPATFNLENRHQSSVTMHDDGPGVYTVVWHNVSGDDGDPNDGQFVFTVAGAAGSASPTPSPAPMPASSGATAQNAAPGSAAPTCVDNGVRTPGITDSRVDTFCKREAIRQKYAGQIDVATFNAALAGGEGLESALADAMADFQMEQSHQKH